MKRLHLFVSETNKCIIEHRVVAVNTFPKTVNIFSDMFLHIGIRGNIARMDGEELSTCLRLQPTRPEKATGTVISRDDDEYYRINHYDAMSPFLVSLTSPSDHWVFLSTSGGITAGRKNADHAIFPYSTVDRVTDAATTTGGITIVLIAHGGDWLRWEPFNRALDSIYSVARSVEKNALGNTITFEVRNVDLRLTFRQSWATSPEYGIVRRCQLTNDSGEKRSVAVLDGIRNTLPALTTAAFNAAFSNLLDAYKRNELLQESGIGIFGLSAVPTDLAEPSEALSATTWWQTGLETQAILLCADQLDQFRRTGEVETESDIKARRGAYIAVSRFGLDTGTSKDWLLCGEVDQDPAEIVALHQRLASSADMRKEVAESITQATSELERILARNDGLQETGNRMTQLHHMANVTYNVMRGGYFAYDYEVPISDFRGFVRRRNRKEAEAQSRFIESLPERLRVDELLSRVSELESATLIRLAHEYLPLTFSRRHGDPSRPWNAFSIESHEPDGSPRLAYQGNWRDIFQNWEALLHTSPLFITSVICKFLNATTIDGYNPYRITDEGIDWERPDPNSVWANIGYWSDHQIVYLQKLLELSEKYQPGELNKLLTTEISSFADVPYVIAPFQQMLDDPNSTITFDDERDRAILRMCEEMGSDAKLLHDEHGTVVHTNMIEKLLILLLAKASNFVPLGGIWMNTQRPEWNDANSALVGKGASVVTTAYLERYASFVKGLIDYSPQPEYLVFETTDQWISEVADALRFGLSPEAKWTPSLRLDFMQRCGNAATTYRASVRRSPSAGRCKVTRERVVELLGLTERFASETVRQNRRHDHLFHSYNTLSVERNERGEPIGVTVLPMFEMLEGQVAAISSHSVPPQEAAQTLDALRNSCMYREDQNSYMLYPNRDLPGFMERNVIPPDAVERSRAIEHLLADNGQQLIVADPAGGVHFNASFRNATILRRHSVEYRARRPSAEFTATDEQELLTLYEDTFHHRNFTGRSGTFYGYEGLGSIYWHMVAKLLLAVQENALSAHRAGDHKLAAELREKYFDIRGGIGFNKQPFEYGAFPADPYSHTPLSGGAKQPGMTGQVKEEIITRFAELGLLIDHGRIVFDGFLVEDCEFLQQPSTLSYVDVNGESQQLDLLAGSFGYTFCQIPIVVTGEVGPPQAVIHWKDGHTVDIDSLTCEDDVSRSVFMKSGDITRIDVRFANDPTV